MTVTSVQLPTRTPDQLILVRLVRETLINLLNETVSNFKKGDITSLTLEDKLNIALSNFLIPYCFLVSTKVVFTRLPDGIPYIRMEDFARLISGTFVSGINIVYVEKDMLTAFLKEDYTLASNTLKV